MQTRAITSNGGTTVYSSVHFELEIYYRINYILIFCHGSTVTVGLGLLIVEVSITHSDTPHSVGLLSTSDQPISETNTLQHTTVSRDRHPRHPAGFELAIPDSRRRQTHASDRAATGIGYYMSYVHFWKVNAVTFLHTHFSVLHGNHVNECALPARVSRFPR
jgi:hypothetical protein